MSLRPTRARRRAPMARRIGALEAMEHRSLVSESLGILMAGIGVPAAVLAGRPAAEGAGQAIRARQRPALAIDDATFRTDLPRPPAPAATGGGPATNPASAPTAPIDPGTQSASTIGATRSIDAAPRPNAITVAQPSAPPKGGGGAGGTSHGGSGAVSLAATTSQPAPASTPAASTNPGLVYPTTGGPSASATAAAPATAPHAARPAGLPVVTAPAASGPSSPAPGPSSVPTTPPTVTTPPTPISAPAPAPVAVPLAPAKLAVGEVLDAKIIPGGIAGPGVSYTITPQPLPANMTFDRTTGELTFTPAPGQGGHYQFTVTTNGTLKAAAVVPIDVTAVPLAATTVSGRVVDELGLPLPGIPVAIGGVTATTDPLGNFTLAGVAANPGPVSAGGAVADLESRQGLLAPVDQMLGHQVYPDAHNVIAQPLILPKINWSGAATFTAGDASKPQTITNPALPGFSFQTVPGISGPVSALGSVKVAQLAPGVSTQHLPVGVQGGLFLYSARGIDLTKPVVLTLPNTGDLKPGAVVQLLKLNVATGGHDVVGDMVVAPDGKTLTSLGALLLAHPAVSTARTQATSTGSPGSPQAAPAAAAENPGFVACLGFADGGPNNSPTFQCSCGSNSGDAQGNTGNSSNGGAIGGFNTPQAVLASDADLVTGAYRLDHATVAYQSQGQGRDITLAYDSLQANPHPVVEWQMTTPLHGNSSSITSVTAQITLGGVSQGPAVTYNTPGGLGDGQTYNLPMQVDASALATGAYPYKLTVTENFGSGSGTTPGSGSGVTPNGIVGSGSGSGSGSSAGTIAITTVNEGFVNVVGRASTPLGAGWSIDGLQQIAQGQGNGPILVNEGQVGTTRFDPVYAAGGFQQDLAASNVATSALVSGNDGRGDFTPGTITSTGNATVATVAGDFNNDGRPDLAILGATTLVMQANNGSGSLGTATTINLPAGYTARALAAGNFTGHFNGTLDLAVVLANTGNGSYAVAVYAGAGDGSFAAPVLSAAGNGSYQGNAPEPNTVAVGDFNGDGRPDLAFTTDEGLVDVMLAAGGGAYGTASSLTLPYQDTAIGVTAADYNGDGKVDLIVQVNNSAPSYWGPPLTGLVAYGGTGSGGFTTQGTYLSNGYNDVNTVGLVTGAFNGPDGGLEVAVPVSSDEGNYVYVVPISAAGVFGNAAMLPTSPYTYGNHSQYGNIVAGDFNGAGKPSIALSDGTNQVRVLLADPDSNSIPGVRTVTFAGGSGSGSGSGSNSTPTPAVGMLAAAAFTGTVATPGFRGTPSEVSTIVHNGDGTWTRSYPDGTVCQFDAQGREVAMTDRNGNATTYGYVPAGQPGAGALQTMTDPVGLATTLAYNPAGTLASITDPAGRVTDVVVDSNGNLTQITDPDGAIERYGYATPSNHLATTETNPDGHTATAHYNSFGQLTGETLFDGTSTTNIAPAQAQGLLAPGQAGTGLPTYQAGLTDAANRTISISYNRGSHPNSTTDATNATTTDTYTARGFVASQTDPQGRTTSYTYDDQGHVTSITQPAPGNPAAPGSGSGSGSGSSSGGVPTTETFVYNDPFGVPTSITDFNGNTTTFALDSRGNVTRRTDPDGLHEDWTYNAAGQPLTDTTRAGNTTRYAYDAYGRLTTITDPGPGSPHKTIGYDAAGDLTSVTDELGHTTGTTYDPAGRILTTQDPVQAAAGVATHYAYDPDGKLTSITDALGHVTSFTYTARDQVATVTDPVHQGTGTHASYAYDAVGNLASITDMRGDTTSFTYDGDNRTATVTDAANEVTRYYYDQAGDLTGTSDPRGNFTGDSYDGRGDLAFVSLPGYADPTGPNGNGGGGSGSGSGSGGSPSYAYSYGSASSYALLHDANGNLTSQTDPLGHATTWTYNALNLPTGTTDALGHATGTTYDADLNKASLVDGLGHATGMTYDARDRLVSRTEPAGGGTTTYTYDDASNLTSVTDPAGNVTRYTYDAANRRATMTSPTGGVTTYTYDDDNNLIQVTDADNRTIKYGYDADDRETSEQWLPAGGGSPTYTMTITYDAVGNVASVQDNSSQYAYTYDAVNRLTGVDNAGTPGSPQVNLTYGYDAAGNRTSLADSLGGRYGYAYNTRNQLDLLSQSGGPGGGVSTELALLQYDQAGNLTGLARFADIAANTSVAATTYTHDAANRLTNLTHTNAGGSTIASYAYTLDAADRLISEAHAWNGGSSTDTITYGYTDNNQLTSATHTNGSFANESFSYDQNGNRNAAGQTTGTGNEVQSDGTYTYAYDAAGNLITKTSIATGVATTYAWDFRNRLTEVDSVSGGVTTVVARFTYDALNRQIREVDDPNGPATTRWTVYDGQTPLLDFNGSGQLQARYLSVPGAIDELLARQTASGVAWYLDDRLGSVKDIVNNSATVLDHVDYGAYGQVAAESAPAQGDRFKYAGTELDAAIGLNYDRARYYDAASERFLGPDPLGFGGKDANLYRYVGNDPTNVIDPSGKLFWVPVIIGIGVIGGLLGSPKPAYAPDVNDPTPPGGDPLLLGVIGCITFGHGARHLAGWALTQSGVEAAIAADVSGLGATGSYWGWVTVDGVVIQYRAYCLATGINIGTYFPVSKILGNN